MDNKFGDGGERELDELRKRTHMEHSVRDSCDEGSLITQVLILGGISPESNMPCATAAVAMVLVAQITPNVVFPVLFPVSP